MSSERRSHLQVVRDEPAPVPGSGSGDAARRAYWARVQALRAERARLRAG